MLYTIDFLGKLCYNHIMYTYVNITGDHILRCARPLHTVLRETFELEGAYFQTYLGEIHTVHPNHDPNKELVFKLSKPLSHALKRQMDITWNIYTQMTFSQTLKNQILLWSREQGFKAGRYRVGIPTELIEYDNDGGPL